MYEASWLWMRLRDGDAEQQVGELRPFQTQVMHLASEVRKGMLVIHVQPLQLFFLLTIWQ